MNLGRSIYVCLYLVFFAIEVGCKGDDYDEERGRLIDTPLPPPYYVESYKEFSLSFLVWSLWLSIAIFLIIAPIPKLGFVQKSVSTVLGAVLATNHLLGFLMLPEAIIWVLSYAVGIVAGVSTIRNYTHKVITSAAGSYILMYLLMIVFAAVNMLYFLIGMSVVFAGLYAVTFLFPDISDYIYKTLVCTLCFCIIVNLTTFFNVIDSVHASDWNLIVNVQGRIGKFIVCVSLVVFPILMILSDFYKDSVEAIFS